MAAIGIYRGPSLIFEYANEELQEILGGDPARYIGKPITTMFRQPDYRGMQAVIEHTFRSGQAHVIDMPAGEMWVVPLSDGCGVGAVATHLVARLRLLPGLPSEPARFAQAG